MAKRIVEDCLQQHQLDFVRMCVILLTGITLPPCGGQTTVRTQATLLGEG